MEEEKAAAYYDELTRKGGGAARFKQGLGFSSSSSSPATTTTADGEPPAKSSSFLSSFVRASSPSKTKVLEKESQLLSIQNKLKKKELGFHDDKTRVRIRDSDKRSPPQRRSRSRSRDRNSRRRSRSRSRERRPRYRSSSRERDRDRRRKRSRSLSPRNRRSEKGRKERKMVKKEVDGNVDYGKLIHGYDHMTPAERVKAKMKLQLSKTAEKDAKIGSGSGWERFEFDKDAPVDDEEIEAADDDAALMKHINKTFRFASLETKREDGIQEAHDKAMFGAPAAPADSHTSDRLDSEEASENENKATRDDDNDDDVDPARSLINEKVLAKQQGSWRDRARRNVG